MTDIHRKSMKHIVKCDKCFQDLMEIIVAESALRARNIAKARIISESIKLDNNRKPRKKWLM